MRKLAVAAAALIAACSPQDPVAQQRFDRFQNAPPPSGVVKGALMGGLPALCGTPGLGNCQDDAHAIHAAYMNRDPQGPGIDDGYCNNCHVGFGLDWYASEFDPAGNRRPAFIAPTAANPNPPKPRFNGWSWWETVSGVYSCSNIACHGQPEHTYTSTFQGGDGNPETHTRLVPGNYKESPIWQTPIDQRSCTACHDAVPNGEAWHQNHANGSFAGANECRTCHPNVLGTVAGGLSLVDPAKHGNGVVEVQGRFRSGCFNCH